MFQANIKKLAKENTNFRKVIYTADFSQLVLMSILPGEDIGEETHQGIDQILFIVEGKGEAVINNRISYIREDDVIFVPAGTRHNFKNTGDDELKLYTIYSPPNHKNGVIHKTKADAQKYEEKRFEQAKTLAEDIYENF